jgi:hypothetical protein
MGRTLTDVARRMEVAGCESKSVYDHFSQVDHVGSVEITMNGA